MVRVKKKEWARIQRVLNTRLRIETPIGMVLADNTLEWYGLLTQYCNVSEEYSFTPLRFTFIPPE
jgi:hypothetical protein